MKRLTKFNYPLIYLISEGTMTGDNFSLQMPRFLKTVRTAVLANIGLIQIREKRLPVSNLIELVRESADIAGKSGTKILVNDRFDIALAANAHGVHLTVNSIPTLTIRSQVPNDFLIGVSTHSIAEAQSAKQSEADFATFGPVFETPSKKKYGAPQGLGRLAEVCINAEDFPILAIGGIDKSNIPFVLKQGASGYAAIRFLNDPENFNTPEFRL